MELEAAVIGVRLLQLIQRNNTLTLDKIFIRSDSQVVLDWIASSKKQNVFVSNRLQEIHKISSPQHCITFQVILIPPITDLAALRQKKFSRNG